MTRAPQKDRARIQQRFVTEFVENHSSYWLFVFFLPKNFVDLRKIYMFLASVIMEQENAAVVINSNLKKQL